VGLLQVSAGGADYLRRFLPTLHRMYAAVFFHPEPSVAAINGHAIAGRCVLACCADRRIMTRGGGRMGITELLVGVPFPALAFEIVRFAVSGRYLPEFTYTGATYDVDERSGIGRPGSVDQAELAADVALLCRNQSHTLTLRRGSRLLGQVLRAA
jgi:enoyl-CoA hydratase